MSTKKTSEGSHHKNSPQIRVASDTHLPLQAKKGRSSGLVVEIDVLDGTARSRHGLLTALLHDLGKVAMLAGEPPEHVVCYTEPVEGVEPGGGLENALFQFGHDEIAYSRFKDHVPEHVAWMLRYHSMLLGKAERYMSAWDREMEARYLKTFRKHDQGSKSPWSLPNGGSLARFRDFIEERFPQPILF